MRSENYQEAKNMFFLYRGNGFNMWHDGVIDKYDTFEVPRELENKWYEEYVEEKIQQLRTEINKDKITSLFFDLGEATEQRGIGAKPFLFIIDYLKCERLKFDSFTLILLAGNLRRALKAYTRKYPNDKKTQKNVKTLCLEILSGILDGPITVSEDFSYMTHYDFSEENLRRRIEDEINQWDTKSDNKL